MNVNKKKGNLKEDDRGWCVVVRCLCALREVGTRIEGSFDQQDAIRCMPDKERGGSAKRCFGLLRRKREKREKNRVG